ncbi:MAG: hypothetical protein N2257_05415 [Thermodesulfovibrionales bacterium]|nr:hypothetical protein [Thermodesulfovibrionales bacterium]
MTEIKLIHDIIVNSIKKRLSREFPEIKINPYGERSYAFQDLYPDLIISAQGMVISVIEVETEETLSEQKVTEWKRLVDSGIKLTVVVPKTEKVKLTDMLWNNGLAGKIGIGTFEININLP